MAPTPAPTAPPTSAPVNGAPAAAPTAAPAPAPTSAPVPVSVEHADSDAPNATIKAAAVSLPVVSIVVMTPTPCVIAIAHTTGGPPDRFRGDVRFLRAKWYYSRLPRFRLKRD